MMIRSYSAKTILALSCSALGLAAAAAAAQSAGPTTLIALARAYRESPVPAKRAALEAYANAHANETNGYLARLALGIAAYEQKDYTVAIEDLRGLPAKLSPISDYAAYYLAAAGVESDGTALVPQDLAPVFRNPLPSPFSGRAWLLEARTLKTAQPAEAVRVLREHFAELPQPEGDIVLADCYQAAGDLAHAVDFYQRVYYGYLTGDAVARAAAALSALKDTMGAAYPAPLPQQELQLADHLLDAREYRHARGEYETLVGQLTGLERDRARVRLGAADLLSGNTAAAYPYLRGLNLSESDADAERQYYLEECARRLTDDDEMIAAVNRLAKLYPQSAWRLKALLGAANRYLVTNRPGDYLPLYRAIYEDFPSDPAAANAHWKVAFQAYLENTNSAPDLLREHIRLYPSHAAVGAALYFLARGAEAQNDPGSAAALYNRLAQIFPNTYYAMLARQRLERPELQGGVPSAKTAEFLTSLAHPQVKPVPTAATNTTVARIERSRLLRSAGLHDLADAELRFAARTDGQPALLAMEMAGSADAPAQGLRMMKSLSSDYLNLPLAGAPEKYWQLLFPLPYRADLVADARARDLDPYLVAGLIRQESEFDPQALSRANAYGLTRFAPGPAANSPVAPAL